MGGVSRSGVVEVRLIPQWRKAWRMFSIQCMTLATAVQGTWIAMPADMRTSLESPWVQWASVGLLVAGIFGRLVDQGIESGEAEK